MEDNPSNLDIVFTRNDGLNAMSPTPISPIKEVDSPIMMARPAPMQSTANLFSHTKPKPISTSPSNNTFATAHTRMKAAQSAVRGSHN